MAKTERETIRKERSETKNIVTHAGKGVDRRYPGCLEPEPPGNCPPLPPQHWDYKSTSPRKHVYVGAGGQTQVLTFVWQALY